MAHGAGVVMMAMAAIFPYNSVFVTCEALTPPLCCSQKVRTMCNILTSVS